VLHGIDVDALGNAYLCCITCTDACSTSLRLGNAFDEGLRRVVEGGAARRVREGHFRGDLTGLCCAHCDTATRPERGAAVPDDPSEWLWFLELELTPRCNLACRMCVHTFRAWEAQPLHEGVERGVDVDPARFRALVDQFHALHDGPKEVRLQWLGEPLLHPRWAALLRHACGDANTAGVLITNGVLLDGDAASTILDVPGTIRVELSINAASAGSYREVTGAGGYEQVVANVRRFLELRKQADREADVAVRIKTLAMPETAGEAGDFLALWRGELDRLGCDHATWWDNQGPAAPTVLCVNSLFAGGFAPADDLLARARGHRGPADPRAQLFMAQYLERFAGHRPARQIREHSLAPLEAFLAETGAGDSNLLNVQALALELREAVEEGEGEFQIDGAVGRLFAGVEWLLDHGGIASADEWEHLSVLLRGLHRYLADHGLGRSGALHVDLEQAVVTLIASAAGRFPGTARSAFLPLLRDVLLPTAPFLSEAPWWAERAVAVNAYLDATAGRGATAEERELWTAAFDLAHAGGGGRILAELGGESVRLAHAVTAALAAVDDADGWLDVQRVVVATILAVPGFASPGAFEQRAPLDEICLRLVQRAADLPGDDLGLEVVTLVRAALLPTAGLRAARGRTRAITTALDALAEAWGATTSAAVPLLSRIFRARAAVRRRPSVRHVNRALGELRSAIETGATVGV
jgi:pyruvate-formate lyase-activating enzyme